MRTRHNPEAQVSPTKFLFQLHNFCADDMNIKNSPSPKYLLDTNVLIRHPRILSRSDAKDIFLIPLAALEQLAIKGFGTSTGPLQRVLAAATNTGVEVVEQPKTAHPFLQPTTEGLDYYDLNILGTLRNLRLQGADATLVTDDNAFRAAANTQGLNAISWNELKRALEQRDSGSNAPLNLTVNEKVDELEKSERWNRGKAFAISVVIAVLAFIIWRTYPGVAAFLASTPEFIVGIGAAILGVAFYWIRQNFRLVYGGVESLVGVTIAAFAFPINSGVDMSSVLQILGGLYVIVRGLDNIGYGLVRYGLGQKWKNIFGNG